MDKLGKVNVFVRINMSLIDDANLASLIKLFFSNEKVYFGFIVEMTINGIFSF